MLTFLDDVAKKILQSNEKLDRIRIIVPSIRAIKFLKEAFKKNLKKPIFAPEIISIESFIEELSGIKKINSQELHFVFYSIYQKLTPVDEQNSLTQFLSWAPSLLSEFNEIDSQLVDSNSIFSFMSAVERIEYWDPKKGGEISKQFFKFQAQVPQLYSNLYRVLIKRQQGYSGLQYREATQNLGHYLESTLPYHYFVGFNALTKSEEVIIQELIAEQKAEILWDLDHSFFEDPFHSAGHFIRNYSKEWTFLRQDFKSQFSNYFLNPKKIEVINVSKNIDQAKAAAQIAIETYRATPSDTIALVLGDEGILQPLLSAISATEVPWNASMGYPLNDLGEANYFLTLFEVLKQANSEKVSVDLIRTLMENQLLTDYLEEKGIDLKKAIQEQKKYRSTTLSLKTVYGKSEAGALLFGPFDNIELFLKRMINLSENLAELAYKNNVSALSIYVSDRMVSLWKQILELHQSNPGMKTLIDVEEVFVSFLRKEKLDFAGDPFLGIQIMGVLESRVLDFDHVIVTHVNEGSLPFGKTPFSSIPFDVRKKYGLNTFIEQDHLYAYHFFRLLQRAKHISLLYNDVSDGLFSGEKSRFLIQLEYFKKPQHELVFKQLDFQLNSPVEAVREGIKTPAVLKRIKEVALQGFSPSSLTQYIRDPFMFYEQRLLKVRPEESQEIEINAAEKGTIIHEVLEELYKPFLGKKLEDYHYAKMLESLPDKLQSCFEKKVQGLGIQTGKNYLIYKVTQELLKGFLKEERALIQEGNSLVIYALEKQFHVPIRLEDKKEELFLKGTVDRIDILNGVTRVVDYKTGSVTAADLAFSDWEELITDPKKSALFQALLYTYALRSDFNGESVITGIIPLKNFNTSFLIASTNEIPRKRVPLKIDESSYAHFEQILFKLINEIFDPKKAFVQKI